MWLYIIILAHLPAHNSGLHLLDLTSRELSSDPTNNPQPLRKMFDITTTETVEKTTRFGEELYRLQIRREAARDDDKDMNIKNKIATLVQQTLHDTTTKVDSIQFMRTNNKGEPAYQVGFILSMIKKARDVMNELFNVAVKHRDDWKTLEQLKIFELVVHTNVDTTYLVRQLVEIHINNLNATKFDSEKLRMI